MKLRLWMGYRSWSLRRTCFQEDFVLLFVETIVTPLPLRCWRRTQSVRLCFTPRACIFRCNRRLLFVEKPLIPFFSIIILLLVTRSHTKTRHRVTLNGTAYWALWISVWDGNPFSASWSYAPEGPGLNWCLTASGNPPPSWQKCCRIGLTFMLLRFDSPPVSAS